MPYLVSSDGCGNKGKHSPHSRRSALPFCVVGEYRGLSMLGGFLRGAWQSKAESIALVS